MNMQSPCNAILSLCYIKQEQQKLVDGVSTPPVPFVSKITFLQIPFQLSSDQATSLTWPLNISFWPLDQMPY